ncbi:MAG: PQQ-binding-like beta-propeller repeat protein [Bryobacteraceae bacterium]
MKQNAYSLAWLAVALIAGGGDLAASQWLTFAGNPQRDAWSRDETILSKENVKSMQLVWKLRLNSPPSELTSLTAPIIVENVLTAEGHKDFVVVAGASDTLDVIDVDTGKLRWHKKFTREGTPRQKPRWLCPNALNATPVIQIGGENPRDRTIQVVSSDGKLHSLNLVNGEDRKPPADFVPPFSKIWSLNLAGGVLYTATSQGCNGAKSGVYAMDLNNPGRPVTFYQSDTAGGGIWGRAGAAVGRDGAVYVETGDGPVDPAQNKYADSVLALAPRTLKLTDYYLPENWSWLNRKDLDLGSMSPVVFPYKQSELIAGAGKEGRVFLLDPKSLGGPDHHTPLFKSPIYLNEDLYSGGRGFWGAFASWVDDKNTRWLAVSGWGPLSSKAPAFPLANGAVHGGAILAFKLEENAGKPVLTPAWISRDMTVPEPPIAANGIVFALANGENVMQANGEGRLMDTEQRLKTAPGHAILYAFDAATGKELFSSGRTMPSIAHFSGIAISNGRVYVTTYDSTLYAFGLHEQ